jgi:hypothetical protein
MIELPGSRSEQADIIRDLAERYRDDVHHAGQLDQRVVRGELGELVGRRRKGQPGEVGHFLGECLAKALGRVEPGTDRRAALR